jgi:long-chain acyl-CoA synthetase
MIFLQKRLSDVYQNDDVVFSAVKKGRVSHLTFADFVGHVNRVAGYFQSIGIAKGHRVMTSLSHGFEWNIIEFAIFQLGAIHVPLAPDYLEQDIAEKLEQIRPEILIANNLFHFSKLDKVVREQKLSIHLVRFDLEDIADQVSFGNIATDFDKEAIAVILFTSGSSARSKAVPLTFKNILTSVDDFSTTDLFDDVEICLDILHHSFSGGRKVNYSALLRGKHICYANSTISISHNIDLYKPHLLTCVPYLAEEILEKLRDNKSFSSLQKIICGGAALSPEVVNEFSQNGVNIYDVYGLTETASLATYNTAKNHKPGSCGKFSSQILFKLNERQELLLKGDSVFNGYYTTEGIENVKDAEGWFNTGDIAQIDEQGYLFLKGRSSGAVKTKKGKFSPEE